MTTHYEKIQALGNKMVSNLGTMGVSATFNDGGLTLADKILQIQHFTDGILFSADKEVIQTGGTVNFTALYLEDGKTVSGKKIIFDGLPSRYITTTPEDTSITMPGDYKIILPDSQDNRQWISLESTDKSIIFGYRIENNSYYMEVDEFPVWITGNSVQVIGSSIYYLDEDGENAILDVSDYTYNEVLTPFLIGGVILEDIFSDITDSYGVASVTYTGVGAGKLNVQAKTIDGSIQSETYEIVDCILAYDGTSSPIPALLQKSNNTYVSMVADNTGLTLSNRHSSSTYYVGLDKEQSSSSISDWMDWCDVAFEFEYVSHTGNVFFQLRPVSSSAIQYSLNNCSNGDIIRVEYSNGVVNVFKNNTNVLTRNMNVGELTAIRFSLAPSNTLTIKNLKIYSI